jgi:hypothetical protein
MPGAERNAGARGLSVGNSVARQRSEQTCPPDPDTTVAVPACPRAFRTSVERGPIQRHGRAGTRCT